MSSGYYRFPTINKDTIVFVSEDDLWGVSVKGGVAWRLTSNVGAVTYPMLSPDGKQLAFVGREEGAPEVYVMPAEGGTARRLTYLGNPCRVLGWNAEGTHILFCSNYGQVIWREYGLFQVAADGVDNAVEELPYGPARTIAQGPKGQIVLGRNTGDPARWKRYRGGTAGHLWIRTKKNEFEHLLPNLSGNIASPLWITKKGRHRIFFVSDHEGVGNLYSCTPTGKDLKRHTDHEDFYVRNPSTDGTQIVYHAGADLYVYDIAKDKTKAVKLDYRSPRIQRNRKFVPATRSVSEANLHPSNQALTMIARGKVFTLYNHEGPAYQHGQRNGVRYRLPSWLNDGARLLLVSDASGEEALEIHTTEMDELPQVLDGLDIGRPLSIKVSPNADNIALTNHRHELILIELKPKEKDKAEADDKVEVEGKEKKKAKTKDIKIKDAEAKVEVDDNANEIVPTITVVDRSPYRRVAGFNWSPDGRWIAYGCGVSEHLTEIRLYRLADPEADDETLRESAIHSVTKPVLHDTSPAFDPDGRYLYFLSSREFNPVYDALHFDLSFPWGMRPYLLTLNNELPNPFVPRPEFTSEPAEEPEEAEDEDDIDDGDEVDNDEGNDDIGEDGGTEGDDENEDDVDDGDEEAGASSERLLANDAANSKLTSNVNGKKDKKEDEKEKAPKRPQMRIDLEGIEQRVLAFPVPDAQYGQVAGVKDKAIFTIYPMSGSLDGDYDWDGDSSSGDGVLRVYDFKEYKAETLVEGINSFGLSRDRKKMIYFSNRRLRVINAGEKAPSNAGPSRKSGWIDLSRAKVSIDRQSEWEQMMREAWRLQRDHFWSEDMSQVDWRAVYERYYPLISRINSRSEFSDLMWEMQGELGTSHAYEYGGDHRRNPAYYGQGFLGTKFTWSEEESGYLVGDLIQGDSWNQSATSPLGAPGIDVKPGDVVVAINGQRLDAENRPEMMLVNQAGSEILLTLKARPKVEDETKTDAKKKSKAKAKSKTKDKTEAIIPNKLSKPEYRSLTVKTLRTESPARYRAWVEGNRQAVHEASKGKVGYVHIPDMGARGYAEFHRGFLAESDREGLIIDVRYNGGGHVSQLILEKLARRRLGYDMSRWGEAVPYPRDSAAGPMVALTNEQAGSDGDIFSHGFKMMKLGPLIGKRTWGGVIGIWPRYALVDGTVTTQPEFSFWFEDVGWGVENYGTVPDIEVDIAPQDYAAGEDTQLQRSIKEALRLIKKNKVKKPDMESRPKLTLPKLPPRK